MRKISLGNNGRKGPPGRTNSQECRAQDVIKEAWASGSGERGAALGTEQATQLGPNHRGP